MLKAHAKILQDQITHMVKNKDRLLNLWQNEIRRIVEQVYEGQRPKPAVEEAIVQTLRLEEVTGKLIDESVEVEVKQEIEDFAKEKEIETISAAKID